MADGDGHFISGAASTQGVGAQQQHQQRSDIRAQYPSMGSSTENTFEGEDPPRSLKSKKCFIDGQLGCKM